MTPTDWAMLPLKKYSDFTGRSRRKEFWFFTLAMMAIYFVASFLDNLVGLGGLVLGLYGPLTFLALLILLTPSLTVGVRRLHDTGRSGWWMLIGLVPLVGLVLLYFFALEGPRGPNQYGPDPKEGEGLASAEA